MIVTNLIAKQLKEQRKKDKTVKVEAIAKRLNISGRTVYRIEEGLFDFHDFDKLTKICDAYKLNPIKVIKNAEADFVQNYLGVDFFTDEEITRYQKQFENFNIEILKKTEERNKNIKDKLRDLVEEIFILNEMFDNEVEKEDLIQLLDVLIKTSIQQIKRNQ